MRRKKTNAEPIKKPTRRVRAMAAAIKEVVANSVPAEHSKDGKPNNDSVLVIDIGGTKAKMLASGKTKPHKARTGPGFTPERLVEIVQSLKHDWTFGAATIGFPGLVGADGPKSEPGNLGPGWVGFDFASALAMPVKIVNDAVMQALGSYDKGRMVFVSFGTGIGSALIEDHMIVPLELGQLRYDSRHTVGDLLNRIALRRYGKKAWRRVIAELVPMLLRAFVADYVVLGGGNAKLIKDLPVGARLGHNRAAFRGGFRLWEKDHDWTLAAPAVSQLRDATRNGRDSKSK